MFGDLKYPADFKRFDYVNPDAPKGGLVRLMSTGTFDNFKSSVSRREGLDRQRRRPDLRNADDRSRTTRSSTAYGLLAEAVAHPDDRSWVIYRLRPAARWHDGKPVTPDDVIFSFDAFKKNSPMYASYYQHIVKLETDRRARSQVHLRRRRAIANCRASSANFRCCRSTGGKARTAQGRKRDITATTLETPLGSGPYRIKEFVAGRTIVLERVPDYWGADLPVRSARIISTSCATSIFRDDTVSLEAFKGDQIRLDPGAQRQALGHRLRFSCGARRARHQGEIFRSAIRPDAGLCLQSAPADCSRMSGCAAPSISPIDFEEMNRQLFVRRVPAQQQLFRRHRTRLVGAAGRQGAADPRNRARQGAARGFHHAVQESGRRQSGSGAQQSARSLAAAEGSRLRDPRPQAGRSRRQAGQRRIPDPGSG